MSKQIYLEIMDRALAAYSEERIDRYLNEVREEGVSEHGFPRLTADIGILMAKGRRLELLDRFIEMMNYCTEQMPNQNFPGLGNDFSIKEICFCLMELEKTDIISREQLEIWKDRLRVVDPYKTYQCIAKSKDDYVGNWAAFSAISEIVRTNYLGGDTRKFIETNLSSQIQMFSESGMYRDPNNPMLYDFGARVQLCVPEFFGYKGDWTDEIDENLERAGDISLKIQTPDGEMLYGGRSNQYIMNEATSAGVYEYEANRYFKKGDLKRAGEFKAAALLAAKAALYWLDFTDSHAKNRYEPDKLMGCEDYGYFLKYMITTTSNVYLAYLYCNEDIEPTVCPAELGGYIAHTDIDFHKVIASFKDYFLEFDTDADFHYDSNGLGRLCKRGAPRAICLYVPFPVDPLYYTEFPNKTVASLCSYIEKDGKTYLGADKGAKYESVLEEIGDDTLKLTMRVTLTNGESVDEAYEITADGVTITLSDNASGILIPVYEFDGKVAPEVKMGDKTIEVYYESYICRYTFDGILMDNPTPLFNRNGRYKVYKMQGKTLKIEIEKA